MGRDVCATEPWVNFPAETGAGEGGAGAVPMEVGWWQGLAHITLWRKPGPLGEEAYMWGAPARGSEEPRGRGDGW